MASDQEIYSNANEEKVNVVIPEYLEEFIDEDIRKEIKEWKNDDESKTALNDALDKNDMRRLKLKLLGGAHYLHEGNKGKTMISSAASRDSIDVIKIIIQRHKHEGTSEGEQTYQQQILNALKATCKTNFCKMAHLLLTETSDHIPGDYLIEAAETGSIGIIMELFAFFPNLDVNTIDDHGNTPLHQAVKKCHIHTVQFLLNRNANPNLKNEKGHNCVHMACQHADQAILYLLTTRGGNVNEEDNEGITPTLMAVLHRKDGCIHVLAAAGANLHGADSEENIPLIKAADKGYTSVVRELILNGATFDLKENIQQTAFSKALKSGNDETAAMIVHLTPRTNYDDKHLEELLDTEENGKNYKKFDSKFIKTMKALLDRTVVKSDGKEEAEVNVRFLQVDKSGKTPNDIEFEKAYIFKDIAESKGEDIAYHGTIRLLVDTKMKQFGNAVLAVQTIFYSLFLLSLVYSLIVIGSHRPISLSEYSHGDILTNMRIITELYILIYFVWDVFSEFVELFQTGQRYYYDIESWSRENMDKFNDLCRSMVTPILRIYVIIASLPLYLSKKSNILDFLGLLTLFILMILRLTTQPAQWIFATLTFLINGVRVYKLMVIIPGIGPYSNTIYKILVKDVPLFSYLFLITLFIFTGGFFISLRTPYTSSGFKNASLMSDTGHVHGVDNEVQWVFLSGIRVLLESNIYDGEYLYRHLNWLSASIYLVFLFLITIVHINVFIAQLSDTYGAVKRNAEKTVVKDRLNFILQVEHTSLLSLILNCRGGFLRKRFYKEKIEISKQQLYDYYGVHDVGSLYTNEFTENVTEKEILTSIKHQQVVTRHIEEMIMFTSKQGHATNTIPLEEIQQRDVKLLEEVQRMNEIFQDKLEKSLLGLIGEKLQALK